MQLEFNLTELEAVADRLKTPVAKARVVAFHGEMGAGKTTLIAALCRALGTHDVTGSPTFSIINQYNTDDGRIIYHMDLYRIESEEEAIQAGVEDALYSGNLCLVEWPEKAGDLLPDDAMHIHIAWLDTKKRKLEFDSGMPLV